MSLYGHNLHRTPIRHGWDLAFPGFIFLRIKGCPFGAHCLQQVQSFSICVFGVGQQFAVYVEESRTRAWHCPTSEEHGCDPKTREIVPVPITNVNEGFPTKKATSQTIQCGSVLNKTEDRDFSQGSLGPPDSGTASFQGFSVFPDSDQPTRGLIFSVYRYT